MIHEIKHNTEEKITNGLVWGAQMFDQSCLVPDNRLLNGNTESAEVMDCVSLFHSGVVMAEKWFFNSVTFLRVMNNLSWVARPLVAL